MKTTLRKSGDSAEIKGSSLTVIVTRQDEGMSVYIVGEHGETIAETWATFDEGKDRE
jgi:hypothetical protein